MRARLICSDPGDYELNMHKTVDKFEARGYNRTRLLQTGQQVAHLSDENVHRPCKKKYITSDNQLLYVSTFDGHAKMIKKAICDSWHILKSDRHIGRLFTNRPKFVYKRGSSIGDQLVWADVQKGNIKGLRAYTDKRGTFACLSCQICTSIIKGDTVHHPMRRHAIKIKGYYTCNSPNVIYGLKCPCGQMYVGKCM